MYICQLYIRQRTDNQNIQGTKKLNSPKINKLINKWATELNRNFSKEEIQMAKRRNSNGQKNHEKMLTISRHKGKQIKTTLRFHLTPFRLGIIKNTDTTMCWQGCGEKGILVHC
jgi:hypothetical protein